MPWMLEPHESYDAMHARHEWVNHYPHDIIMHSENTYGEDVDFPLRFRVNPKWSLTCLYWSL